MRTKRTKRQFQVGRNGYVLTLRCAKGHGGNRGLVESQRDTFACVGCGQFFTVEALNTAAIDANPGENGGGGLYRTAIDGVVYP